MVGVHESVWYIVKTSPYCGNHLISSFWTFFLNVLWTMVNHNYELLNKNRLYRQTTSDIVSSSLTNTLVSPHNIYQIQSNNEVVPKKMYQQNSLSNDMFPSYSLTQCKISTWSRNIINDYVLLMTHQGFLFDDGNFVVNDNDGKIHTIDTIQRYTWPGSIIESQWSVLAVRRPCASSKELVRHDFQQSQTSGFRYDFHCLYRCTIRWEI